VRLDHLLSREYVSEAGGGKSEHLKLLPLAFRAKN